MPFPMHPGCSILGMETDWYIYQHHGHYSPPEHSNISSLHQHSSAQARMGVATKRDRNVPPGIVDPTRRFITNTVTRETLEITKYGAESTGEYTEAIITCKSGGGPPLHYHTSYREEFMAVEGDLVVEVGGSMTALKPGESAEVPIGAVHRFTTLEGEEARFKGRAIPSHAGFERSLYIMFGLANDGFAGEDGLPRSPIQKALIADMSDMRFAGGMGWLANTSVMLMAMYGRWTGEEERLLKKYWD